MITRDYYGEWQVTIQKYKLKYDINKLNEELNELWPLDRYQERVFDRLTYNAFFQRVTEGTMPEHIKEAIELSIGRPVKDYFFLWDWRNLTNILQKHRDDTNFEKQHLYELWNYDKEKRASIPHEVAIVSLENIFTLNIWDDSNSKILKVKQSVTYEPGDIITFNNNDYLHSGEVLHKDIPRRTLNCYV